MLSFQNFQRLLPRQLNLLVFLIALLSALMATALFLYRDHQRDVQALLDRSLSALAISWQAVQVQQRYSVATYFEEYVQSPRPLELLRAARDPDQIDQARQDLFEYLSPAYERLVERGIRQLHFHTPEGDSFLRFHHPARYGDNLSTIRESIRLANTELRPVFGFEVGRVVSGYRAVFPIFDTDGKHLGSVELSMPFRVLMEELQALVPDQSFQLLLETKRQREILFDEQQSLYEPWEASDAFLIEDPRGFRTDSPPPLQDDIQDVIAQIGERVDLLQRMVAGDAIAFAIRVGGKDYMVLQVPVFDPGSTPVGVLVAYQLEPELTRMTQAWRFRLIGTFLTMLGLAFAVLQIVRVLEQKLSERRRLTVITDTVGQGLYLTDARGLIVDINPYACEVLGLEAEAVVGRSAHYLFHCNPGNDFQSEHHCDIMNEVQNGREYRRETQFQHRDGRLVEVSVVSRPLNREGRFTGAVTVFDDISKRKQAERALLESRQRLANILWGTGVGTWEWNVRTGETRFNERWAEMIGYTLEDIEPVSIATWERFAHPDDLTLSEEALYRHFKGESEHYEAEIRMLHQSGEWIWVLDRGRVISRGADGKPEWMAGTHLDITQRKRAQQDSSELLERYRKLGRELPGFVYQYLLRPDGRGAFAYASSGVAEIYGVTPEQIETDATPVYNVIHEADSKRVFETIFESARNLTIWQDTYRVNHPGKGVIWVEGHATPERLDDGSVLWHGYIRDVTERRQAELRLEASEASYRALVDNAPVIMFRSEIAPPWRMLHISHGAERICGYHSNQFMTGHLNWADLIWPDDVHRVEAALARAIAERGRYGIEYRIRHTSGDARWVSELGSVQTLEEASGGLCLEGVISDITDRKSAEEAAREARLLLQAAMENSPSGIIIADAMDSRIRFANRAAQELQLTERRAGPGTGEELTVYSERWRVLRPNGEALPVEEWPLSRAIRRERVSGEEAILIGADGIERWITMAAVPIEDSTGKVAAGIVVFTDITAQKNVQEHLQHTAHYDALTGLPNRILLADRLNQAMQRALRSGRKLALVFIDLDEFKSVNDRHGHAFGDQLLIEMARRMSGVLRVVDTLARLGGDEFVAVLSDLESSQTAEMLSDRLLEMLSTPVRIDDLELKISGSIGIAIYPQNADIDQIELMRQADVAMYQAKLKGRNCRQFFDPTLESELTTAQSPMA